MFDKALSTLLPIDLLLAFGLLFPFYPLWKQEIYGFPMFSGGLKWVNRLPTVYVLLSIRSKFQYNKSLNPNISHRF